MMLPSFMANPNEHETKLLEQKYKKVRTNVQQIYLNKNFLEETFNKLISNQ